MNIIPHNSDPVGILNGIKCFALDMDGTVYLGERWIDGAVEFLAALEHTGREYVFMTNNSSKSADAYLQKLRGMGLEIKPERLISSGCATIAFLQKNYNGKRVYLLGNSALAAEFSAAGILLDKSSPEVAVTAFDTSLDYPKLCEVCDFVRSGIPYIATHPDVNCPTETGFIPDIGSFHALIAASTGRWPDKIIGKPNAEIIEFMLSRTGFSAGATAVVGDRLYTDIAAGVNNNLTSILVLSGETRLEDLGGSQILPDLIFDSVGEMIPFLKRG